MFTQCKSNRVLLFPGVFLLQCFTLADNRATLTKQIKFLYSSLFNTSGVILGIRDLWIYSKFVAIV